MSNEIAIQEKADLMSALKNSLYPGATDESCELVLAFCRASGMNPLLKPVHIVPMWNSKEGKSKDTIMPGIGMYRINAERSGAYAGLSEPEFGPDVNEEFPAEEYEKEMDLVEEIAESVRKAEKKCEELWKLSGRYHESQEGELMSHIYDADWLLDRLKEKYDKKGEE